jgi:DNA-binding NtrC family response regulator
MTTTRVLILEGPNGQAFFFKETLLGEGLASQVDLVSRAEMAIELLDDKNEYCLVVINLVEAWEQGMQLGLWLSQQNLDCPTILIIAPQFNRPFPFNGVSVLLTEPVSLRDFANTVRNILDPSRETVSAQVQHDLPTYVESPSWSGEPLHQEYEGYWSSFSSSFLT